MTTRGKKYGIDKPVLTYLAPAQTMPGQLWGLVYPDGERKVFLLDSVLEAYTFARHYDADVDAMPEEVSPMRALDWQNVREALFVPVARVSTQAVDDRPKGRASGGLTDGDHMHSSDFGVFGGGA